MKDILVVGSLINAPIFLLFLCVWYMSYAPVVPEANLENIYRNLGMIVIRMVDPTQREVHDAEVMYSIK